MSQVFVQSNLEKFRSNKRFIAQYILAFYLLSPHVLLAEGLSAANTQHAPEIINAANGVPVVNVNAPSSGGVSRNEYQDFNVQQQGLILNNSPEIVDTELAGYIDGNAALTGNSASIILNEVVGDNASLLQGYTEVAGSSAEIVIANQNGITCNGCGFINITRSTLTTGQLLFNNDTFAGFDVSRGQISIGEQGFNASNLDQVDLLARSIELNGKVWANYLNTITGSNTISSDLSEVTVTNSEEDKPQVALDVAALGGMYANRIRLIGTEQGLGVNLGGDVIATSSLNIDAKGKVTNQSKIATNQLELVAENLENQEAASIISASSPANFSIENELVNQGSIKAQAINISAESVKNEGASAVIASDSNIDIEARTIQNNSDALIYSKGQTRLKASSEIQNEAQIESLLSLNVESNTLTNSGGIRSNDTIQLDVAESLLNQNGSISTTKNVSLDTASLDNHNAVIQGGSIAIDAESVKNQGASSLIQASASTTINATNNIENVDGAFIISETIFLNAINALLNSGTIYSSNSLDVVANSVENTGSMITINQGVSVSTNRLINNKIINGQTVNLVAGDLINSGDLASIQSTGVLSLDVSNDFINKYGASLTSLDSLVMEVDGLISNVQAAIQAVNNISIHSLSFVNGDGSILKSYEGSLTTNTGSYLNQGLISANDITVAAQSITNRGQSAQIQAAGQLELVSTQGDIQNLDSAVLYTQNSMDMTAAKDIVNNSGTIQSETQISLRGHLFENDQHSAVIAKAGQLTIDLESDLKNSGSLKGSSVQINATALDNQGEQAQIQSAGVMDITVTQGDLSNQDGGVISSLENMTLNVWNAIQNAGSYIKSSLGLTANTQHLENDTTGAIAATNDLLVNVDSVSNEGLIQGNNISLNTKTFLNQGDTAQIQAKSDLALTVLEEDLVNQGTIFAANQLNLSAEKNKLNNQKILQAGGDITLNFTDIQNNAGASLTSTHGDMTISVGELNNQGVIGADNLTVSVDAFTNAGSQAAIQAKDNLNINVANSDINNQDGATLFGWNSLVLTTTQAINNVGSYIQSVFDVALNAISFSNDEQSAVLAQKGTLEIITGDTSNTGSLTGHDISLTSNRFENSGDRAQIQATHNASISVDQSDIVNSNRAVIYAGNHLDITAVNKTHNIVNDGAVIQSNQSASLEGNQLSNSNGAVVAAVGDWLNVEVNDVINTSLIVAHDVNINTSTFENTGSQAQIQAKGDLGIQSNNGIDNYDGALLYSEDSITLTTNGDVENLSARIEASDQLSINATNVRNEKAIFEYEETILSQTAEREYVPPPSGYLSATKNYTESLIDRGITGNSNQSYLISGSDMNISVSGELNNVYSIISAGNEFDFVGNAFNNYSYDPRNHIAREGTITYVKRECIKESWFGGCRKYGNVESYEDYYAKFADQSDLQPSLVENSAVVQTANNANIQVNELNNAYGSILSALNGTLTISSQQDQENTIHNEGVISGHNLDLTAYEITNYGAGAQIQAIDQLEAYVQSNLYNQQGALIYAQGQDQDQDQGNANISVGAGLYNISSTIETSGDLTIAANKIDNTDDFTDNGSNLIANGDMTLSGDLRNLGSVIQSFSDFNQLEGYFYNKSDAVFKAMTGTANFESGYWNNYGFVGANDLVVSAGSITNKNDQALVLALNTLDVETTSGDLNNTGGAVLYSGNDSNYVLNGIFKNDGSYVESGSTLNIKATDLLNLNRGFTVSVKNEEIGKAVDKEVDNSVLTGDPGKVHKVYENSITSKKTLWISNEGTPSEILASGAININLTGELKNSYSKISSASDIEIYAEKLINESYAESSVTTTTGKYSAVVLRKNCFDTGLGKVCDGWKGRKDDPSYHEDFEKIKNDSPDTDPSLKIYGSIISAGGTISGTVGNLTNGELEDLDTNQVETVADRKDQEKQVETTDSKLAKADLEVSSADVQSTEDVELNNDEAELQQVDEVALSETEAVNDVMAEDISDASNDDISDSLTELTPVDPNDLTVDLSDTDLNELSDGALFSQADNDEHNYLIETNPHFTEYQNFISSDYMLERMGLDVDEADNIRLGDGYFEQDLVRDQVLDLTGEQYINDYENTEEQYLALMDNALEAQNDLDLALGVALTAEQIQSLNKPIVWLVEQEFETENGIQVALVPQVYFTNAMQMLLREDGALIAGENVDLEVKEALANSGSIQAKEKLKLVAEDIKNTGKIEATEQIDLIAQRDMINQSGTIDGGSVTIKAGRDFINETKVEIIDINSGNYSGKQSLIDEFAIINADELTIISGNDVQLIGSDINVENDLVIQAVNDIEISTAKILEEAISGKYYNVSSSQHITTEIGAGTVLMLASETFTSEGANIQAKDGLDISAKDIELLAVKNTEDKDIFMNYGGGNTKHVQSHTESVVGTQLNTTGVLRLTSENDIFSKGTDLVGDQGIALNAGGSILLTTEEAFNSSRVDTTSKKSGVTGSTRKKSTYISESLTNTGTTLTSDGNIVIASGADVVLHGTDVSAGEHVAIDAAGDLLVTAAIDNFYEHYTKTKKGSISQSAKNVGSKTQEAVATNLTAGGSMSINSGGNVAVVGSNLTAKDTLTIGNSIIAKDESGNTLQNENGQFVNESGEQVGNVTVTTQELTNEEWHEESSGLRGVFKDIAGGLSFVAGSFGIDAEIEVGRSSEIRTSEVTQESSNLQASNLGIDVQGDVAIVGSNVNVDNLASINANSVTLDAAQEQATQHHSETVTTMSSAGPSLGEDEVTVGSISKTDQTESTTTESTTWKGSSLNAGTLIVNTDEAVSIISSDINVAGDTSIKAEDVLISGRQDETTTTNTSKTKTETVSLGIKNAYADTAFAIKALNDAKNAARDAEDAYQDARQKVDAGLMPESELRYFETNMAAAAANVANATLAVASAGATAAATTGTGGFYATGSASVETSESSSSNTDKTWNGSNLNIGGNANLSAENSLEVKGSNIAVAGGLQLDAKDINLLAGENSSNTSSESSFHSESASYSTSGGPSGSVSADKSESSSESHYYTNTQIVVGTLSSDSENLTLSGANVDAGVVDITTDNLVVESLQNTSSSNSKTQGADVGIGSGGISSAGINQQKSESSSAWVDQQSGITGGTVNIKAKDATFKGGVIAAVDENGNDNGQLSFATETLTVEDIQDYSTSSDKGFSLNTGSGSTTVGANYSGHDTEQTTKATIGNGKVTVGGADLADTDIDVNRDTSKAQEITKDHELGGLDASVTLDHRVLTEEGRKSIEKDFVDTTQHVKEIGQAIEDIATTDIGLIDGIKNVDKYASDRKVLAEKAMNADAQKALKGEEGAQGSEDALQALSNELSKEEGLAENTDVNLYDGSQTPDNTPVESANDFNKQESLAGYHENGENGGNDVYLNIDKTDMTDSSDVVKSLVHEQERHSQAQNGSSLSATDQTTLATNRGDQAQDSWDAYSDLAGIDTKSTTSQKTWNDKNRNSENVVKATEQMRERVNSEEVEPLGPAVPIVVGVIGLMGGSIESANAPDIDEEPTDEARSVLPTDWALEAGSEIAKENTPDWADEYIDLAVMVGGNPVKVVKDGFEVVGDVLKKGDKDIASPQQNNLNERYTENSDGTITGPNGGNATPTGVYDIETQKEINKRESGGYYVENDGKQEIVNSPYPNDGSTVQVNRDRHEAAKDDVAEQLDTQGARVTTEVTMKGNSQTARVDVSVDTTEPSLKAPEGYETINRSTGETVTHITPDDQGKAIIEVKTGNAKESAQQTAVYDACQMGSAVGCGNKAFEAGYDKETAPTAVYVATKKE